MTEPYRKSVVSFPKRLPMTQQFVRCLLVVGIISGIFLPAGDLFSASKYRNKFRHVGMEEKEELYENEQPSDEPKPEEAQAERIEITPAPVAEEMAPEQTVDSWFSVGFSDFSLNKLKLILPSFIEVTPNSELVGKVNWNVEGFSQMSFDTDAHITNLRIRHPGLASRPVD